MRHETKETNEMVQKGDKWEKWDMKWDENEERELGSIYMVNLFQDENNSEESSHSILFIFILKKKRERYLSEKWGKERDKTTK